MSCMDYLQAGNAWNNSWSYLSGCVDGLGIAGCTLRCATRVARPVRARGAHLVTAGLVLHSELPTEVSASCEPARHICLIFNVNACNVVKLLACPECVSSRWLTLMADLKPG